MSVGLPLEKMTLKEKLDAMEALWADLSRQEADLDVPEWQKRVLDQREQAIAEGKAEFIDWEIAKKRLTSRPS